MDRQEYERRNQERGAKRQHKFLYRKFWKWRPTWWPTASDKFAFFVALFTAVLAVVAGLQTCVLSNQLSEMKDENRAWLAAGKLIPPSPEDFQILKPPPYKPAVIAFTYTNTGREPAFAVNQSLDFRSIKNVWDKRNLISVICEILHGKTCKEIPIDSDGSTVFPNATHQALFRLTESQTLIAMSGGQYTMVAGCLSYQTNGESHWTEVCRILDPIEPPDGPGFRSIFCPVYNRAE